MNSQTVSGNQPRQKRVRVEPTAAPIPENDGAPCSNSKTVKKVTPKARAITTIDEHSATLLPQLSAILSKLANDHIDLLHRLHEKSAQLQRMEADEGIIPRSARLKFELTVSKKVEAHPDFIKLQEALDADVANMRTQLRNRIIECIRLEIKVLQNELDEHLAKSLYTSVNAILLSTNKSPTVTSVHRTAAYLLEENSEEILKHTSTALAQFKPKYTLAHSLPSFPNTSSSVSQSQTQSPYFSTQPTTATPPIEGTDIIHRTYSSLFISPFDNYLQQQTANEIDLKMKKLLHEELTASATEDAADCVMKETSASKELISELVEKAAAHQNRKLISELNSLKQQLASLKKGQRGHALPTNGASQKRNATKKQKGRARQQSPPSTANSHENNGNASTKKQQKSNQALQKKKNGKRSKQSRTEKRK